MFIHNLSIAILYLYGGGELYLVDGRVWAKEPCFWLKRFLTQARIKPGLLDQQEKA